VLKILCSLSIFAFLGCKSLNDAPISRLYIVDIQHNICSVRKITDKNTLASVWIEDLPLYACDGNVSLNMQEFLNLRTYMKGKK